MAKRRHKMIRANTPHVPTPLKFTATVALQAASGEGEEQKRPTFAINAYNGGAMNVSDYYTPVIVDLGGLKASRAKIPIFLQHDPLRVIGQADKIDISPKGVNLSGSITGDDADAQKVLTHAKNGFEWQASIGASIQRREYLEPGKSTTVNGQKVTGPLVIARESTLVETSFVPIGADQTTSANVAAQNRKESAMNEFDKWLQAKGFDPNNVTDVQKTALKAAYDAEQAAGDDDDEAPAPKIGKNGKKISASSKVNTTSLAQIKAEHERSEAINAMACDYARKHPTQIDTIQAAAARAMEDGMSPQELELQLLRDCRATAPSNAIGRKDQKELDGRMIEAAICMAGRLNDIEKQFKPEVLEAAHQRWPHGIGLEETLLLFAGRHGFQGSRRQTESLLRAAFQRDIQASGFSTISLPGILANVANKYLLEGYNGVESTWREIASIRPVRDFKTVTGYRMTGAMQFEKVAPDGEIKHGTIGEESFTNKADTYGKMFAITRTDIINDDLGSLTAVPRRIGRGGSLKLNEVFWLEFLDNTAFFTSGHSNLLTGGSSVLSSTSLASAVSKFLKMTDPDGKPLGSMPDRLLVPPELALTAEELFVATNLNTGGSSTTDRVPNANIFRNKYRPIVSAYLSNTAMSGSSATAWYLLDNPNNIPVIEVVFLNGVQQPTVESADADFNVLGIQMRGYFDFGVSLQDYRGGVRSNGA